MKDLWHKVWPDPGSFIRASAEDLEKFAELIRADEREVRSMRWDDLIAKAVEAEREACAKLFDLNDTNLFWGSQAARYIREKENK
jgi:hypothetical protein